MSQDERDNGTGPPSRSDGSASPLASEELRTFRKACFWEPAEARELVKRVFDSEAYRNLQILAFGNFSYEGRYEEECVLFCRDHGGFRQLTDRDVYLWDLVNNNMDMLSACPFEAIMKSEIEA
jgi:hypothetical protein